MRSSVRYWLLRLVNGVSREEYDYANALYHKDREKAEKIADNLVERVEALSVRLKNTEEINVQLNLNLTAAIRKEQTYKELAVKATLAWRELEQKAEDALGTYADEIELLREDNQAAYEKLTRLLKAKTELFNEVTSLKTSQGDERRAVMKLQRENEELDEQVSELKTELRLLRERLNVADVTAKTSTNEVVTLEKLRLLEFEYEAFKNESKRATDEANVRYVTEIGNLQDKLEEANVASDKLRKELANCSSTLAYSDKVSDKLRNENEQLRRAASGATDKEERLNATIKALVDMYGVSEADARYSVAKFKTSLDFIQEQIVEAFDCLQQVANKNSKRFLDEVFKLLRDSGIERK